MTYRKKIAIVFMGYSLFLTLIYSILIWGSLFITEDRLHERILNQYYETTIHSGIAKHSADKHSALVTFEIFDNDKVPEHYKGLNVGIVELNDRHLLVKKLDNGQWIFLSFPEFYTLIDQVEPYVVTLLLVVGLVMILVGAMIAVLLARQLSRPIERLVKNVRAASVDSERIVEEGSSKELGLLARSFNEAMLHLKMALERETGFTQSVSHELRSPLMVLESNLAILKTHKDPLSVLPRVTDRMLRATSNMTSLSNVFLILARHDKFTLEPTSFNPFEIIDTTIKSGERSTINWIIKCPKEIKVRAPNELFTIVITNIIDNGNKYAEGKATITITDEYMETQNPIKQGQLDSGSSQLGIAIVERICNALNWRIYHGTTGFVFHLRIDFNLPITRSWTAHNNC